MKDLFPEGRPAHDDGQVVTRYGIRDLAGAIIAVHVRRERTNGKTFSWELPDGRRGLGGRPVASLPLFGSERIATWAADAPVIVTEGEKAASALLAGVCAVGTVTGAATIPETGVLEVLRGRHIVLWPDADVQGRRHMARIADQLRAIALSVRVFDWPGAGTGDDAVEYVASHGVGERLRTDLAAAPAVDEWRKSLGDSVPVGEAQPASQPPVSPSASQASRLVGLAGDCELFHGPDGSPYVTTRANDHAETYSLSSTAARLWLARMWYRRMGGAPGREAVDGALENLKARALFDGPERPVFVRVAGHGAAVYLDLTNERWEAVEITADGWRVVQTPPVRFKRTRGMMPLPTPVTAGNLSMLRHFVNLAGDGDWILLISWLLATLRPRGPYPVLALHGEQGSAKSTTARVVRALTDPNQAPLRAEPHEQRDLIIAANNGWMLAFDNMSRVSPWLSDAICRLATGGGYSTRALYTDSDEILFDGQRPVILNGVEELAARGDLLDRAILLALPPIDRKARRTEESIWKEFESARPQLLGALLDALAGALRKLPEVQLPELPRMADFALLAASAAPALGSTAEDFLTAYAGNRSDAHEVALDGSMITELIVNFVDGCVEWTGTMADLLAQIESLVPEGRHRERGWPRNARALSGALRRAAPDLRSIGIIVDWLPRTGSRRPIRLMKVGGATVTTVTTVTERPDRPETRGSDGDVGADRSVTGQPDRHPVSGPESPYMGESDAKDDGNDDGDDLPPGLASGRRDWEVTAAGSPPTALAPCPHCGGLVFWRHRQGGELKCERCHPKPAEDVVGERVRVGPACVGAATPSVPRAPVAGSGVIGHSSESAIPRGAANQRILPISQKPIEPCGRCRRTQFWLSRYGTWWCNGCRPPEVPQLAVDRMDLSSPADGVGRD
jgi:hypothetical protein